MPLDPQIVEVMEAMASLGLPPADTVSPEEARANARLRKRSPGPEVAKVEDRTIPGPDSDIPVRIYTPEGTGPFPILLWFHGGGWVVGDLESADGSARNLCVGGQCVVVSVDYRLAPDTKFPGPAEDCWAATTWAVNNSAIINGDSTRLAVGGDSAGGNLAAAMSLMAADRGGPEIALQVLVYPVTDVNFNTISYTDNAEGYSLTKVGMQWYWEHYLESEADAKNPYAAPLQADSLVGQPPAIVITAEFDPLRDEGEAYAKRLTEAGVAATAIRYDGMIHGFFSMASVVDKSQQAVDEASAALRSAFSRSGHPSPAD
ncbi:MAG: alpha/beta hydrolase [Chloroflexota bacterium]|nr:alpha/beta hydrolase [Dehalococcoidia bacterium]MEC9013872.1 alpha/beta hydrolase [Chloroflexota bacterium]MED5207870.1 alpha/beta hydrolase [Chloroflexota bacterium]MEE3014871.1 alpha/beta hydrolase [Chloroflexota bacterium]|tara:strand:- start:2583 stop:3533 length:951 start_codon:yes stop_codon:yes gene_type:complete